MPTHDDAILTVQLLQWMATAGVDDAMRDVFAHDFDPDTADGADPSVDKMMVFGEVIGTLTKHGLLDTDFALDLWTIGSMWERVGPAALKDRAQLGQPGLMENFEALAAQAAAHSSR